MYFFWRIQLGRRMNRLLFIDCLAVYLLGGYLEHTLFILSAIRSSTQLTTRNQSTAYFWYAHTKDQKAAKIMLSVLCKMQARLNNQRISKMNICVGIEHWTNTNCRYTYVWKISIQVCTILRFFPSPIPFGSLATPTQYAAWYSCFSMIQIITKIMIYPMV